MLIPDIHPDHTEHRTVNRMHSCGPSVYYIRISRLPNTPRSAELPGHKKAARSLARERAAFLLAGDSEARL